MAEWIVPICISVGVIACLAFGAVAARAHWRRMDAMTEEERAEFERWEAW